MNTIVIAQNEQDQEQAIDVHVKLLDSRIIIISDFIDDKVATEVVASLLMKDIESNDEITIFINSDGGFIRSIFCIYDTMKLLSSPIKTVCAGAVMDEALLLLVAGNKRYITKNSIIVGSHLVTKGSSLGSFSDAKIIMELVKKDNEKFIKELANCINKPYKTVFKDFLNKKIFKAEEAVKYGLVTSIARSEKVNNEE